MSFFENAIYTLERLGVADVMLPFMLIFVISYMALLKVPVLNGNKKVPIVIALVLGLAVIFPHVTGNYSYSYGHDVVEIINESLPSIGLILVIILSILLVIGALGFSLVDFGGSALGGGLAIIALLLVSGIFGESAGWFDRFYLLDWFGPDAQAIILIAGLFYLFVTMVTSTDNNNESTWIDSFMELLKSITKK